MLRLGAWQAASRFGFAVGCSSDACGAHRNAVTQCSAGA
jgi:hypothetical protein